VSVMTRLRPVLRRYGPDPAQFGELWLPSVRSAATVVIVHGGFWRARYDSSLGRPLAADLTRRGHAVWNLEYRRVGAAGGWPATFEDIAAGIDVLAELPVAAAHVAAIGHSAGGHLAAWAAGRAGPGCTRPAAITSLSSILTRRTGGWPARLCPGCSACPAVIPGRAAVRPARTSGRAAASVPTVSKEPYGG
jgi:acetyl esterase/lipase